MTAKLYRRMSLVLFPFFLLLPQYIAQADQLNEEGRVTVKGAGITIPTDPEKPGEPVNPGPGPSTEGSLRIDFISNLNFGRVEITDKKRQFFSQAQLFHSDTNPRGYYIQITDERQRADGWTLQVKQEYQFRNTVIAHKSQQELKGSVLSFDNGWANSLGASVMKAPTVTRDTIELNSIGESYEVAKAENRTGMGIWTIEFGASETNDTHQKVTLSPLKDTNNEPILDPNYQKQAYSNSAVSLTVPNETAIFPVEYETEITWTLAKLP
ncbi:WxL domain-containing protein [uncultured Vagococcus sp.]|uniref:WxL domain-containing protein n=1 Tax=uncultured Vagococcus sp. TaxID=189676 RepID=UPI0028D4B6AD|nr:WxL domain-containing protein [uncultured Vagococcus sp.]